MTTFLALLALQFPAGASAPAVPTAITNITVLDGKGAKLEHALVLLRDGRIEKIDTDGDAPTGYEIVDGTGKILTPGLIEARAQLGVIEVGLEPSTRDHQLTNSGAVHPDFRAYEGYNPASARIAVAREEGVTHAVIAPFGGIVAGPGAFVALDGRLDRLPDESDEVAIFGRVGEFAVDQAGSSRGGVWRVLRRLFDDARYYAKNRQKVDSGASTRPLSVSNLGLAALGPVLEGKLPLVLRANRASTVLRALKFAESQNIRIVIADGIEAWQVAPQLAKAGVPVVLRPSDQEPATFARLAARDDAATVLRASGVTVVLSAWEWGNNIRRLRQEAGRAVREGLAPEEALIAVTSAPATLYGRGATHGSVEAGKSASLVLWTADPFELSTIAERIWIDGREQSLDTRQRQLANRYLDR